MMLAKRIIPCLDVTSGRVVKGVNFVDLRDAGDPVEIARRYDEQGADELSFLDITASSDERGTDPAHHRGGGRAGVHPADRRRRRAHGGRTCATCSTPAPTRSASTPPPCCNPSWWREASGKFGSQCIVVADRRQARGRRRSAALGGLHPRRTPPTGLDAVDWGRRVQELGAGEILLTSMDRDGTRQASTSS